MVVLQESFLLSLNPSTASHISTMTLSHSSASLFLLCIQKTKITASGPITSWEIDGETVADFLLKALEEIKFKGDFPGSRRG